jgi:4-amino-4-deoxy-L-arabinose transferase-like glycosyltransferase
VGQTKHPKKTPATKTQPAAGAGTAKRLLVPVALAVVIVVGVALRVINLAGVASRSPDEGVYTQYASRIADQGLGVIPTLVAEYERDPGNWVYPPPTRIGHMGLVAAAMKVSGVRDESAGAAVSCLFSCLSLALLAWFGWRFFNGWIAVLAVTFLAASVGELGMAQRAWQDAPFGFFGLLLVYLTAEITRSPRRLVLYLGFFAAGVYSLLMKETGIVAYGLCGAWVLGVLLVKERSWKAAALLAVGGVASLAGTALVWSVLCSGMGPALSALNHAARSRSSEWTVLNCSGPWYQFPYLLWIVGPATAGLALAGTVVAVLPGRLLPGVAGVGQPVDPRAAWVTALITLGFIAFASFVPNFQYLRIVSPADGPYCLLAGLGLWYLLSLARGTLPEADYRALVVLAAVGIAIAAARDYHTFRALVDSRMGDFAVRFIREVMQR